MRYLITRKGLKTPRSRKLTDIIVASADTLQGAIDICKNSGFEYYGRTYIGDWLRYSKDNSIWTITGEFTFDNGKSIITSYKTTGINL
jgi:hypothetical protein